MTGDCEPAVRGALGPDQELVAGWRAVARAAGFSDFIRPNDNFRSQVGSARRWGNRGRPGIYFWLADNGEAYVGQSVRPQQRLRQHLLAHADMVEAAFQRCSKPVLNAVEAKLVQSCSQHFPLRNIKLAVSTTRAVPIDELLSSDEREAFLSGLNLPQGPWRDELERARLRERHFRRLVELGGEEAVRAVQLFVERVIPKPQETEVAFWSVSVLPSRRMLRLNVGQQEVFTAELQGEQVKVRVLTGERVRLLGSWRMNYQTPSYENAMWAPRLSDFLIGARLLSARSLVVRLMRHTQALNSESHCPQVLRMRSGGASDIRLGRVRHELRGA